MLFGRPVDIKFFGRSKPFCHNNLEAEILSQYGVPIRIGAHKEVQKGPSVQQHRKRMKL